MCVFEDKKIMEAAGIIAVIKRFHSSEYVLQVLLSKIDYRLNEKMWSLKFDVGKKVA